MRVLLIEDDKDLAETLGLQLSKYYIVDLAFSGEDGEYKAYINEYDLIIIDISLPDTDGIVLCRKLRSNNLKSPILFLTGRCETEDIVEALDAGGDDYMSKPFSFHELLARIRALLRRNNTLLNDDILIVDDLVLDVVTRNVVRDSKHIPLRRKEFDLLEYLMRNKNRVLTRGMILEHVWESNIDEFSNTVDVHVKYLRDKVDKPFKKTSIKTVHGIGYKIENT
ncbi:hypothetical protein A3G65_00950 [Candidatus Roizmanbacteria bacterium RIFCSPLOWO2_12_FULL_37_7b]|nr:MAG: hypothetical protein A3G65_00950 [Candidatus Roizmanbacteria bacterium RIFCSPLOWO2_12_FULL_37_7b]HJZ24113.1 response regulator transcription factor [Candidatus Babeliales bacterium]